MTGNMKVKSCQEPVQFVFSQRSDIAGMSSTREQSYRLAAQYRSIRVWHIYMNTKPRSPNILTALQIACLNIVTDNITVCGQHPDPFTTPTNVDSLVQRLIKNTINIGPIIEIETERVRADKTSERMMTCKLIAWCVVDPGFGPGRFERGNSVPESSKEVGATDVPGEV